VASLGCGGTNGGQETQLRVLVTGAAVNEPPRDSALRADRGLGGETSVELFGGYVQRMQGPGRQLRSEWDDDA
jgi:hypothetical protein